MRNSENCMMLFWNGNAIKGDRVGNPRRSRSAGLRRSSGRWVRVASMRGGGKQIFAVSINYGRARARALLDTR
jgi:hypothetical protein